MEFKIVWQYGSSHPENASNLELIRDWWASLNDKPVNWLQRLLPHSGDLGELNWEPQRFDETFVMKNPEIRGITLYWYKSDSPLERNSTVEKLELDQLRQQLYIYPQTQKELVIQVALPEIKYQTLTLKNPLIQYKSEQNNVILTLRDEAEEVEVNVTFTPEKLKQLKELL